MEPFLHAHLPRDLVGVAVAYFASKSRDWYEAARAGEFEACVRTGRFYEDDIMPGACRGGHLALVKHMLNIGEPASNWALQKAAKSGNIAIVNLLIPRTTDYDWALSAACRHGHVHIATVLLRHTNTGVEEAFGDACGGGHVAAAKLMVAHGADELMYGFYRACDKDHLHVVQYLIELVRHIPQSLNSPLRFAVTHNRKRIADYLVTCGATHGTKSL
jgi:hypothetical protein